MPKCSLCYTVFIGDRCPACGQPIPRDCNHENQNLDGFAAKEDQDLFDWMPSMSEYQQPAEQDEPSNTQEPAASSGGWVKDTAARKVKARPTVHLGRTASASGTKRNKKNFLPIFIAIITLTSAFIGIISDAVESEIDVAVPSQSVVDEYHYDGEITDSDHEILPSGMIAELIGTDREPGVYCLTAPEGYYSFFTLSYDENEEEIFYSELFENRFYIELTDKTYFRYDEFVTITPIEEAPPVDYQEGMLLPAGMYLVGTDIPVGDYLIEPVSSEYEAYIRVSGSPAADYESYIWSEHFSEPTVVSLFMNEYVHIFDATLEKTDSFTLE